MPSSAPLYSASQLSIQPTPAEAILAAARKAAIAILLIAGACLAGLLVAGFALQPVAERISASATPPSPATVQTASAAKLADVAETQGTGSLREAVLPSGASASDYVIRGILDVKGPLEHGDYAWTDEPIAGGPLLITVDLTAQTLSVFRGGYEIGVAVIMYGADHKPTPTGEFTVTQKDADHISNLYNAPMPYMLRLTNDGISIHGSEVEWGYATHGCIGVPTEFARMLFEQVKLGDRVIITDGSMMKLGDRVPTA